MSSGAWNFTPSSSTQGAWREGLYGTPSSGQRCRSKTSQIHKPSTLRGPSLATEWDRGARGMLSRRGMPIASANSAARSPVTGRIPAPVRLAPEVRRVRVGLSPKPFRSWAWPIRHAIKRRSVPGLRMRARSQGSSWHGWRGRAPTARTRRCRHRRWQRAQRRGSRRSSGSCQDPQRPATMG